MQKRSRTSPSLSVGALAPAVTVLLCLLSPVGAQKQFDELGRRYLPNGSAEASAVGDVDGDGDVDIVCGNQLAQDLLLLGDGTGRFVDVTAAQMPPDQEWTEDVALGDVDGDGDLDLVLATGGGGPSGGQNRLYLNDGAGTFTDVTLTHMPLRSVRTLSVVLGDVDRDGDLDVVFGDWSTEPFRNSLYLNDGGGRFSVGGSVFGASPVVLGDVDGDGDLDLASGGPFANQPYLQLFLNDGSGGFVGVSATNLPAGGASPHALADVDGDGDLDLLPALLEGYSYPLGLFLNDGRGRFTNVTASRMPGSGATAVAVGDVDGDGDGDGDLDLVVGNYGRSPNEQNVLYLNDGAGTFSDATSRLPALLDDTLGLAVGDVDGDTDLDVVFANSQTENDRLYLNLLRQVSSRDFATLGRPYTLDFHAKAGFAPGPQTALPFLSLVEANPPIPVPPFGSLGLDPSALVVLSPLTIPAPGGLFSLTFAIPNVPTAAGQALYVQAFVQHAAALTSWRLSNVHAEVLRR